MELPPIRTTLNDPKRGVKYHLYAYREVTRDELIMAVRMFNANRGNKKPKKGEEFIIISTLHD